MTEPIGRKSIRETIGKLKVNLVCELTTFLEYDRQKYKLALDFARKVIEKMVDTEDKKGRMLLEALTDISEYDSEIVDLMRAYNLYVEPLESYLSELDETFDKILEEARKMAEEQIKKRPKERPEFYG